MNREEIWQHAKRYGDLDFRDVFILPQYSEIETRSMVDTSIQVGKLKLNIPVLSSNMDTVSGASLCRAMYGAGGIGALHRFMTIENNVIEYRAVAENGLYECFVSIGVNEDSKSRAKALYEAGARYFVIDIAHGHSLMMRKMTEWLRDTYPDIYIISGNVATSEGVRDLVKWGADACKEGVGPGSQCLTKNVTGITCPPFSAALNCSKVVDDYELKTHNGNRPLIIADGGIAEYGDIAKAIGAGVDLVMIGGMFAGCKEAPGERIGNKKVFRGMASKSAMLTIRSANKLPTAEGKVTLIEATDISASTVLEEMHGGLRSSLSYSNSRTIEEYHSNVEFGVRLNKSIKI